MKKINGAQLCARFAYKPSDLKYCGSEESPKDAIMCIKSGSCSAFRKNIKSFKSLYPYLKTISHKYNLDILDYKVVEAYWIGNDLLKGFTKEDFEFYLKILQRCNRSDFFIKKTRDRFIENKLNFIPHHAFNVFLVGIGNVSSKAELNLENLNNCLITGGRVVGMNKSKAKINVRKLKLVDRQKLCFISVEEGVEVKQSFIKELQKGDYIVRHWNSVCLKLTKEQLSKVYLFNKINLRQFQKQIGI